MISASNINQFCAVVDKIFTSSVRIGELDAIRARLSEIITKTQKKRRDELDSRASEKELKIEIGDFVTWKEGERVQGKRLFPTFEGTCEEVYPAFYVLRLESGAKRTIKRINNYDILDIKRGGKHDGRERDRK